MVLEEGARRGDASRSALGRVQWASHASRPDLAYLLGERGTIRCQRQPSLQYFLDHPTTVVGPEEDSGTGPDASSPTGLQDRAEDDADLTGDVRSPVSRLPDWARVLRKLRIYVQRLQWRRALHFQALDAGVGVALGWVEARGSSPLFARGVLLLGGLLRRLLSALLGRPRSVTGAATIAALSQFVLVGRD